MEEQYSEAETWALAALEGKRNERELRECIRQAARLLQQAIADDAPSQASTVEPSTWQQIDAWLELPTVQSALALEAADRGE